MATKPIERLLFAQGGNCFFCEKPLPRDHASVEHLVAQTHGGKDNDENCVATCKTLNALFGRMSLKEKLKIVIHQKGAFKCPASQTKALASPQSAQPSVEAPKPKPAAKKAVAARATPRSRDERLELVIKDLKRRGNSRPGKQDTLENTIRAYLVQLGEAPGELPGIMRDLQTRAYVSIENKKVTYQLP